MPIYAQKRYLVLIKIIPFIILYNKALSILFLVYIHISPYMIWCEVNIMYENNFSDRLSQLRIKKGVSARDMSLSLGQNVNYINNIETGKSLPSMTAFFYICEYLNVSPMEFFDFAAEDPWQNKEVGEKIKLLPPQQLSAIMTLINGLISHK